MEQQGNSPALASFTLQVGGRLLRNAAHSSGATRHHAFEHPVCDSRETTAATRQAPEGSQGKGGPQFKGAGLFRGFGNAVRRGALSISAGAGLLHGSGGTARAFPLWPFHRERKRKPAANGRKKRVMVLMSDTGGGHRASAQAIKAGFQKLYGDEYHFDIVDPWTEHTYFPFNRAANSYSFLVRNPWLWKFGYTVTQPRIVHVPMQHMMGLMVGWKISQAYARYQPDLVVSVHPLMQGVPLRVLKSRVKQGLQDPISFATVVTDLCTCHNTWFHRDVDKCFVATEETARRARSMGLSDEQIVVHGLPIRPAFATKQPSKSKLRKQLGMVQEVPAVLVVAGGEGVGPVQRTVKAIAKTVGASVQLVVVCGRNAGLVNRLQQTRWPAGMHVVVQGFVHNMEEWMHASDVIITKAGPGTIAESFICGLPVLLNGFIPGQEEGNVDYVLENQVGAFQREPQKIAETVKAWAGKDADTGGFSAMQKRAKMLGTPNALFDICKDLAELANHPTFLRLRDQRPALALQPA